MKLLLYIQENLCSNWVSLIFFPYYLDLKKRVEHSINDTKLLNEISQDFFDRPYLPMNSYNSMAKGI